MVVKCYSLFVFLYNFIVVKDGRIEQIILWIYFSEMFQVPQILFEIISV